MGVRPFKRVVVWGYPLHTNTFSYVYYGFVRAFRHLGYDTYWLPDRPTDIDLSGTLVISANLADTHVPIHGGATYVLHNSKAEKFAAVRERCLWIQVLTNKAVGAAGAQELDPWAFFRPDPRSLGCLYQPWATDLLPHEIDLADAGVGADRTSVWVGTVRTGDEDRLSGWIRACDENGVRWSPVHARVDVETNRLLVRDSYLSPTVVGAWQLEHGYIPCRSFKNVSYGQIGATNSAAVDRVFGGRAVYNPDSYELFADAEKARADTARIRDAMVFVRDHHTYLNRIARILECVS